MNGNSPQNRDELLVTGIPSVADPPPEPRADPGTETKPLTAAEPVFVDASGWRTRLGRRLGLLTGALLIVFLGALGLGMTTGTDVPLTPWSEPSPHPRVQVSHPPKAKPTPTKRTAPPSTGPTPTSRVAAPAAPATPRASSTPTTAPGRAASTSNPGRSTAQPPAWGRNKKKNP
ncbi:hypothetical protein SAMN05443665_103616 [Actinomadura meyerae]|uniref:Uncharacterized protein n=1 Tax=Actinomadura meyerae TaxID=240840 RepID=A0A239N5N2_9ACTN|nr:hypothetical protein [Actinomadura meyerae]SNT49773.1 hypothetical protein SAMN05443665_103616 [Actinomadura meyerae]